MQGPAADRIGYLAKQLQQQVRQAMDAALRPHGLSAAQYAVLLTVAAHPGIAAAELARQTFVTRQSLQDVLGGLRRAGLVEVTYSGVGRRRSLALTEPARRLLAGADDAVAEVERRMVSGVSADDLARTVEVMRRLRDNLTRDSPTP